MQQLKRSTMNKKNLWDSSSDDDDIDTVNDVPILSTVTTYNQLNENLSPSTQLPLNNNSNTSRLSLLPAFPSLHQHGVVVYRGREHLLLANISRHRLTNEQRRQREQGAMQKAFTLIDQRNSGTQMPSLFLELYGQLYTDLAQRLHVDETILDYNYERLFKCMDIMTNERIQYRFQAAHSHYFHCEQLPVSDYAIALEFFLQIDVDLFYMKTCSFRGARPPTTHQQHGLFCHDEPLARYGMARCQERNCYFCFPLPAIMDIRVTQKHQQRYEPVVQFLPVQQHRFVSGYEAILNCPTSCRTKNIIYALTCPCGQFDYIGYTSMTLSQRLFYHRKHGNRIMREFILGPTNVQQLDKETKSYEDSIKDGMRLYHHSARCSMAMQWFLNANPNYWSLVPLTKEQAEIDNKFYVLPSFIPADPTSPVTTARYVRSDLDAGTFMTHLPPLPSNNYTFSTRQCAEQFQIFKNEHNQLLPNNNLDLYNATVIAVLPENCSGPLQRIVEALFITHAETKLNTIGHLDQSFVNNNNINSNPDGMNETKIITDRGDWCANLIRPQRLSS